MLLKPLFEILCDIIPVVKSVGNVPNGRCRSGRILTETKRNIAKIVFHFNFFQLLRLFFHASLVRIRAGPQVRRNDFLSAKLCGQCRGCKLPNNGLDRRYSPLRYMSYGLCFETKAGIKDKG